MFEKENKLIEVKNENLKIKIKEKFIELSSASTSHGYPNIFRTKYWSVRIMWLFFFLISTGFCIFMIYRSINDYISYDVVNKIRNYPEMPMAFPTITFCNVNPFINNESDILIKEFLPITFNVSYFETTYDFNDTYYENDSYTNTYEPEYYTETIVANYLTLQSAREKASNKAMNPEYGDENRKKLWYPLNEILINCYYNEKLCKNVSNFTWTYLYDYGNCYQFNTGKDENDNNINIKKSFIAGNKNGIYLELYAGEAESIYSLQPDSGLVLFIHNQSTKPNPSEGILLKTNSLTSIILKKIITQRQPDPYSDCQDLNSFDFDKTLYKAIIESGSAYSQKECFDLCLQQITIKKCGCYHLRYLNLLNSTPCLTINETDCALNEYLNFIDNDINGICKNFCPLECDSQYFEYKISSSSFPTKNYSNILNLNPALVAHQNILDSTSFQNKLVAFAIYFENLQYTLISESPKTLVYDIIANVGGTLGLFIGISLLSVIEILEIVIEIFMIWLKTKNQNKIKVSS